MILMVLFGGYGLTQLSRQVLPDFVLDVININVQWPGASPADVEANILEAIEPEVRFLENVDRVDSGALEGSAGISITYREGTNMSAALTDVQAAVSRITTFPVDMERPVIYQVVQGDDVCRIEISGPFPEENLKNVAKRIRDDLLGLGMARITMVGMRDTEIRVEISDDVLRQLDLTVNDVASRIEQSSLDLPSGSVESGGVLRQIRSETMARSAREVAEIEVLSQKTGEKLRLKDVSRIYETFEDNAITHIVGDYTGVELVVGRAKGVDSIDAQRIVTEYVEEIRAEFPPTLQVEMYDVFADQATQRVRMLVNNGFTGLLLVMLVLYVFLNGRVAFWVAMGIPISILAALGGMAVLGLTLNMISMFAIIMGLGIIVDDAIVIGEHTEMLHRHGMSPQEATITAAHKMFAPVMAASLTTIAAFFPIIMISGVMGNIVRELPIVIILVIIASLVECFLVLPMHLRGALQRLDVRSDKTPSGWHVKFNYFRDGRFSSAVKYCFQRRYSTVLATICAFLIATSLLVSGRVGFELFANPETDLVYGNFVLNPGARRESSEAMLQEMVRAAHVVEDQFTEGQGGLIAYEVGAVGTTGGRAGAAVLTGDHVGSLVIELITSDERDVRTGAFMRAWEKEVQRQPGVERVTIFEFSAGGPPGRDLDVRLYGADLDILKAAAMEVRARLRTVPGVMAVSDNLPYGKQEIVMEVTPAGKAKGFTNQNVARQVRNAFEGAIAQRFSRDQEEVIVRVKLSQLSIMRETIRDLYLRAPDGSEVPITEVVDFKSEVGFSQIRREDGLRQVSVTAEVETGVTTSNVVIGIVNRDIAPDVKRDFGVFLEFKGRAAEQQTALGDMRIVLLLALSMMYIVLAWVFSSYTTPFVVMAIIPFGLIGAIVGHYVMGLNLTMLSLQALLGLSGVMINDSIILVMTIKRLIGEGKALQESVLVGARERLRPVLLTTLTTIGGVTPLLFERSLQAQLVQPLAVTLIFGLLVSPLLVLFFVPSLLGIGTDLRSRGKRQIGEVASV
jgi:multidrug efflux pump subunit AcrB